MERERGSMGRKAEALILLAGTMAGCAAPGNATMEAGHGASSEASLPSKEKELSASDWRDTINMLGGWAFTACQDPANTCTRTINVDPADTRPLSEANGIDKIEVTSSNGASTVVVEGVHLENRDKRWVEYVEVRYTDSPNTPFGFTATAWTDGVSFREGAHTNQGRVMGDQWAGDITMGGNAFEEWLNKEKLLKGFDPLSGLYE